MDEDVEVAEHLGTLARKGFDGFQVSQVELEERALSAQVGELARLARDGGDYAGEQFMQWFIKEQVEEVATMSDLLAVVTRHADDIGTIEDYVAREHSAGAADATAPRIAGA